MNQLVTAVFKMYADIDVGQNHTCRKFIASERASGSRLGKPVSLLYIGDKFAEDERRVLFVGKNAVNCSELPVIGGRFHDASWRDAELYRERFSAFWSYTEEIVCHLFGVGREEALRRIAFTNMVKCNHSTGEVRKDTTSDSMKRHCAVDLGVIRREIAILKPKSVVFYTHNDYDNQISQFRYGHRFEDVTAQSRTVQVGEKTILWWHRRFFERDAVVLEFLRTSHPERMKKGEYVTKIAKWLTDRTV